MNSTLAFVLIVLVGAGGIAAGWMLRTARTPATADHDNGAGYGPLVVTAPAPAAVPHGMSIDADRRLVNSLIGIHDLDGGISAVNGSAKTSRR